MVLALRCGKRYPPKHFNLMWNISHPDKVEDTEFGVYDHFFVASAPHAAILGHRFDASVSPLRQCASPQLFYPDVGRKGSRTEVLFLGNSWQRCRPAVMDAIAAYLPLTVYGGRYEGLIDELYVEAAHVPIAQVRRRQSSAEVVFKDNPPSMRDIGCVPTPGARLGETQPTGAPPCGTRLRAHLDWSTQVSLRVVASSTRGPAGRPSSRTPGSASGRSSVMP